MFGILKKSWDYFRSQCLGHVDRTKSAIQIDIRIGSFRIVMCGEPSAD
jgi:hypothetical protein